MHQLTFASALVAQGGGGTVKQKDGFVRAIDKWAGSITIGKGCDSMRWPREHQRYIRSDLWKGAEAALVGADAESPEVLGDTTLSASVRIA